MLTVDTQCVHVRAKPFSVPVLNFFTKTKQLSSHAMLSGRGRGGVVWGGVVCYSLLLLSVLHLLANFVAQDLVPVNLGACHRKLAA